MSNGWGVVVVAWITFIGMVLGALRWDKDEFVASKTFERSVVHRRISKMRTTRRIISIGAVYAIATTVLIPTLYSLSDLGVVIKNEESVGYIIVTYMLVPIIYLPIEMFCAEHRRRQYQAKENAERAAKKRTRQHK